MHRFIAIGLFTSVACAPLVSQRDFAENPSRYRRAAGGGAVETARAEPQPPAPAPVVVARAPAPAPKPILVRAAEPKPEPVVRAPEPEPEPEPEVVEAPAEPTLRNFYAFSDDEIRALKKRSPSFKRLITKHKRCTKKTQRLITKRQRLRDKIIHLQNLDAPTRKQLERLTKLRKTEHRMKKDTGALAACQTLEDQLTMRLRETYDATASLDY